MSGLPQNPIFIVGYPRSGTTLLQRLLAGLPGVYTFPESHYFCVVEKQLAWDGQGYILPDSLPAACAKVSEKMAMTFSDGELARLLARSVSKELTSKDLFEYIVTRALSSVQPQIDSQSSYRWLEKTPNHALFVDRILQFYPQAQLLHILRHPVPAVCSRKIKFPFNRELPVEELARRWLKMMQRLDRFKQDFPGVILTVRYEDLVADMASVMGRVQSFLGLLDENISALQSANPSRIGAAAFILAAESWKFEDLKTEIRNTNESYRALISLAEIDAIESIVGPVMERFGYESYCRSGAGYVI